MAALTTLAHALIGAPEPLPRDVLDRYPELAQARWRRGGVFPRIAGLCLGGSTTGGTTWNANPGQSTLRDGDVTDVVMDPDDPSILFIGVKTVGVERSDDAGASFNTVLPWSRASSPSSQMIKIATGRLGSVSTRVVAAKLGQNVFVSRHGGRAPDATGGGAWEWVGLVGGTGYGDWCHVIAVDPFDDDVLLVGAQTLLRVTLSDGAVTEVVDFYEPHEDQQRIVFDPTQAGVVYLANDGGVFRSTDGGITWYSPDRASEVRAKRDLNDGLVTAQFFRVGVAGTNAVGNLMHSGVIATDRLPSGRWLPAEGHGWEFANVYGDPRRFEYFYLLEATLARRRYPETGSGDLITTWGNFRPTAIAVDQRPASQTILAASFDTAITLWRTLDGSVPAPAWTAETVPGLSDPDGFIVAIMFAPSEPGMAYILTQAGRVWQKSDVNSDAEWEYRGASSVIARDLAVNSLHADRIYIAGQFEALRSPNGGADWTPMPGRVPHELPSTELNSIVEYPGAGDVVVIGAASGVYITHDEGGEWHPYDDDLPNAEVLQVFWRGRYLYAVTYGRGLWRRRACL